MEWLAKNKAYIIFAVSVICIGLALITAIVALHKINKDNYNPKNHATFVPIQEINSCNRDHARGFVDGYNRGILVYCETGVVITKIPATTKKCYDTGYERGFMHGVELAHNSPAQCENRVKLPAPIPIDEAELK